MILDIVGITFIILFFIRGYMKGFIIAAFSLLAIVLGVICALKLSHALAVFLFDRGIVTSGWAQLVSYIIIFVGVVLLVRLIAKAIETALKLVMLGLVNKLFGGILYVFMAAFIWSSLLWLLNQMHLISPETIAASHTYKWFSPIAPWVCDRIGHLLPFAKNAFTDLQQFFNNVNQKLPQHVGAAR